MIGVEQITCIADGDVTGFRSKWHCNLNGRGELAVRLRNVFFAWSKITRKELDVRVVGKSHWLVGKKEKTQRGKHKETSLH